MTALTTNASEIIRTIKALVAKGDHANAKAEQFYIAAGQHLKTLKAEHAGTWDQWEKLLKNKLSLSTGRASELMQIADGRKTLAEVRSGKAESVRKVRASSSLRSEESREVALAIRQELPAVSREVQITVQPPATAPIVDERVALRRAWDAASYKTQFQFFAGIAEKLAANLEPLLDRLFVEGATKNMTTMSPGAVLELAVEIERLLVQHGVMPESRRSKDPQSYQQSVRAKTAAQFKKDLESRQQAKPQPPKTQPTPASALPPELVPVDDYPVMPPGLVRARKPTTH